MAAVAAANAERIAVLLAEASPNGADCDTSAEIALRAIRDLWSSTEGHDSDLWAGIGEIADSRTTIYDEVPAAREAARQAALVASLLAGYTVGSVHSDRDLLELDAAYARLGAALAQAKVEELDREEG